MKMTKLISLLLAVLMVASALTVIVGAENAAPAEPKYSTKTGNGKSLMLWDDSKKEYAYKTGQYKDKNGKIVTVSTPEEKIALMDYRYGNEKFEVYVDAYSGEVAVRNKVTGDTLFTNPYNIGFDQYASGKKASEDVLSQLKVHYTDVKTNIKGSLNSYTMAAARNQIVVKNINGGIRVEYSIGREESQSLLPHMIEAKAFEEIVATIETNMEAAIAAGTVGDEKKQGDERQKLKSFKSFYIRYCLDDAINDTVREEWKTQYPILKKFESLAATDESYKGMAIYVLDEATLGEQKMKVLESLIKTYHKEYTYQDLQDAHAFVEYEAEVENYPHFKMALEYSLDETGLVVRLPANGIRFDETLFRLDYIEVLPYMGAGKNPNEGYTFFPDGSGTLFDFQEMAGISKEYSGKVYGQDFAYHEPSGMYEEIIRYPVFGIYEKTPTGVDENGKTTYRDRGFVAIIEEGDSLMELATVHGGKANEYNTVKMRVYPRPTDSYTLADAISVGSNDKWTVVSARKYTGSYKVKYIMLTDDDVAAGTNEKCYAPSYVGMANAYRDYLVNNGTLSKLTASDVKNDIPLYIETFGALETTEKFLSIPVNVMTPLTTFEDITTIYGNLKDNQITNVNFIMKGFTKGGMTSPSVPYNLKWEKAVSKEMDFEELMADAKDNGYSLFPDFDFVYASNNTLFDGLTENKHLAKTIDDRYTSKREYSATKHTYVSFFELVISPAYFDHFYEKFIPKYSKYSPMGISVSTLGSSLNSDFDEDEPYNRADGQKFTEEAFAYIANEENYTKGEVSDIKVMTSGGNAYSWKYVDHITDISVDSSRYALSSAAVPFLGIVLHGYVQTAGTPINMEGNLDYALLKAIENGASLKFILSYRNTEKLKEYETLSKYYSVNYDIWYNKGQGDLVTMYKELNSLLSDVQLSEIVGHDFVEGIRVPDDDELALDAEQIIKDTIEYETALANANSEDDRLAIFNARQLITKAHKFFYANSAFDATSINNLTAKVAAFEALYNDYCTLNGEASKALAELQAIQQYHAIFSDFDKNSFGNAFSTAYKVEDAIAAYNATLTSEAASDASIQDNWTKYQAILGADYTAKLVAMIEAEKAYNANKEDKALETAYNAAVEALNGATAGVAVDKIDAMVLAMNNSELNTLKDAYIAAYTENPDSAETKAAQAAFDAKVEEVYADVLVGNVYNITYGDKAVGGSQTLRNHYRDVVYKELAAKLDAKLNELCAAATEIKAVQDQINKVYNVTDIKAAYKHLVDNGAYTSVELDDLADLIDEIEAFTTNPIYTSAMGSTAVADFADAAAKYQALYDATDAAGKEVAVGNIKDYELSGGKASNYFTTAPGLAIKDTQLTTFVSVTEKPVAPERNEQKYVSDDNLIVHETYANGKEFLLNFNNYRVVVELNGSTYTVEAYGYLVIKQANKA